MAAEIKKYEKRLLRWLAVALLTSDIPIRDMLTSQASDRITAKISCTLDVTC